MDMFFKKLDAGDFLTFIALCIAAFAFMCQYLGYLKNFLKNLASYDQKEDRKQNFKDNEKGIEQIINYFFVIDLFTAWTLVFLIFSIIWSLGFLTVSLQLEEFVYTYKGYTYKRYAYKGLRCFLFVTTIIYIILLIFIFMKVNRLRKKDWKNKSRLGWLICSVVLLLAGSSPLIYFSWPSYQSSQLGGFFISMLGNLVSLFACLVFALWKYNPLTNLAILWKILNRNSRDVNNEE